MPEYLAPGVYVEEIQTGPVPIEGVSTSTAGFVGVARRGPVDGLPVLVTNFGDFRRRFGGFLPESFGDSRFLAYAVQGFFDNLGQRVFIRRVVDAAARSSALEFEDGIVTRLRRDMTVPLTSARLVSQRGISVGTNVTFRETVAGVPVVQNRAVTAYNAETGEISWALALPRAFTRDGTTVVVRAPAPPPILRVEAADPGAWGDDIRVFFEHAVAGRSEMTSGVVIPVEPISVVPVFAGGVGPDPVANPLGIDLAAGHNLVTGDTVEFIRGPHQESRRIVVAANNISWAGPVQHDYNPGGTIRMMTAARAGTAVIHIPAALANQLAPNDVIRISGGGVEETVTIQAAWVPAADVLLTGNLLNAYLEGSTVTLTSSAVRVGSNRVRVLSGRNFYVGARVELDNGTNRAYFTVDAIDGNTLTLSANAANEFDIGNFVRLIEFSMVVRFLSDAEQADETERFDGLTMNPEVVAKYIVNVVNTRSKFVRVTDLPAAGDSPTTPDGLPARLTGGDDGNPPPDEAFVGDDFGPGRRTGIQALGDIDQISIVAAPGKTAQVIQNALIQQCELLRDRFAVLDPPVGATLQQVQDFRNLYDTKYAALYYPWIVVRDPLLAANRNMPPSGHVIGIYARVDNTRGVHKAPANETVLGIVGLEQTINKREQDILNPSPVNINVIRDFRPDGRGIRVYGGRCITTDTISKYVNVRRLLIFLSESLDQGTQFAVFEPNDPKLWARLIQSVSNFLTRVWKDGALFGTKPEEAFFVRCGFTTMTTDDIENGRLIMLIGVAPVKPAEFVIIRITQFPAGSAVEEL